MVYFLPHLILLISLWLIQTDKVKFSNYLLTSMFCFFFNLFSLCMGKAITRPWCCLSVKLYLTVKNLVNACVARGANTVLVAGWLKILYHWLSLDAMVVSEVCFVIVHCTYSPRTRKMRYNLRNHAKLKLKLNAFGRLTENLSDLSSNGIAFHIRVPENVWNEIQSIETMETKNTHRTKHYSKPLDKYRE